jgi:hypothetical protein
MSEKNNVVLTMRTQFHEQVKESYRDSFALAMFLKAFSPSEIYEFLTRWPFGKNAEQNIARIYKDLTDRPTLREMCSNPLILSMYVADDQAAGHVVAPETRTEFYSKVTEELIIRRRLQQTGPAIATSTLREQRQRILGTLAYEHLLNPSQPTNSLSWRDAIRVVGQVMKCDSYEAEVIFREIAKETGLVTEERTSQSLRFIHLTLCEFLAAFEAVQGRKDGWSTLIAAHKSFQEQAQMRSRLVEVIPFACGLLPRINRADAITEASSLVDSNLMSLCFLETKLYDHECWPTFVSSEQKALLATPEDRWDEQWLRRLHLFNVVVRDAHNSSTHLASVGETPELSLFFKTLVASQQSSLSKLLSAYAAQDAAAAFRLAEVSGLDLAQNFPEVIISNCDQAPFFALIRDQAMSEMHRVGLWASLLCEAALNSLFVARMMMKVPAEARLDPVLERLPKRIRWYKGSGIERSFYTQLLSIAGGESSRPPETPKLNLLRRLPAPGCKIVWSPLVCSGMMLLLAIMLALFTFLTTPALRSVSRLESRLLTGSLFLGAILFFLFITGRMTLWAGYRGIIRLRTVSAAPTLPSPHREHRSVRLLRIFFLPQSDSTNFLGRKYGPIVKELMHSTK